MSLQYNENGGEGLDQVYERCESVAVLCDANDGVKDKI